MIVNCKWHMGERLIFIFFYLFVCVCVCVCIYIYIYIYTQGVPGGMDKTSGECSLG